MVYPKSIVPELPELLLLYLATPEAGWTAERAHLSEIAERKIRIELQKLKSREKTDQLLNDLRRVYSDAVAIALAQIALREEAEERAKVKGEPGRPPVKLGVKMRENLRSFIARLEFAQSREERANFCADLAGEPVLGNVVTTLLETATKGSRTDPLVCAPEEVFTHLPEILRETDVAVSDAVKPGKTDAAVNFIARLFVGYYDKVTGTLPTRTTDPYDKGRDKGPALQVCRILAEELNNTLPQKHRRERPADMAGPYRKAIKNARRD